VIWRNNAPFLQTMMIYSTYIHEFLDGTLDAASEDALFVAMGAQEDLRNEFKDMLRLKLTVRRDTAAFIPPNASTSAVFDRLGFAVPTALASHSGTLSSSSSQVGKSSAGVVAAFMLWYSQYSAVVISAVTSVLLTLLCVGAYEQLFDNKEFSAQSLNVPASGLQHQHASTLDNPTAVSVAVQPAVREIIRERVVIREVLRSANGASEPPSMDGTFPAMMHSDGSLSNGGVLLQDSAHLQRLPQQASENVPLDQHTQTKEQPPTLPLSAVEPALWSHTAALRSPARSVQLGVQPNALPLNEPDGLYRWCTELRGLTAQSLVAPTLPAGGGIAQLNNTALSVRYVLDEHNSFGVELGQEAYFQQFLNTRPDGTFRVDQHPVLQWFGVAYRHQWMPEKMFSPFVHTVIGGTVVGGMGRAMAGVTFRPDARTQFMLGVEASSLVYVHQAVWNVSPKVGLSYGVSVRF
jgi:hypothetical protein